MPTFRELQRAARQPQPQLPVVRLALTGDCATQMLATALQGEAAMRGFRLELFEADYAQVERSIMDPQSELRLFQPEVVVVFQCVQAFSRLHARRNMAEKALVAEERLTFWREACADEGLKGVKILYLNYPELDDGIFGSFSNSVAGSLLSQLRALNQGLAQLSREFSHFSVCDLSALQAQLGQQRMFAPSIYASTDLTLSLEALPYVAARIIDIVAAWRGNFHKVLICDLDNTLWGGVVGDDGMENLQIGHGLGIGKVYAEIQLWVRKLRERGIIVCVVSKNDEAVARGPFVHHPDMVLRLDDIAVFIANWDNKADNVRRVQSILQIGYDQMVFLDDNPFERAMVRENVEGICVPELPDDPAEWLDYLAAQNLFETASVGKADAERTAQYQAEQRRQSTAQKFTDEAAFLASLQMKAKVEGFTPFNTPRVAQLTQRSNQFNLRTVRYDEAQIAALETDAATHCMAFSLSDRFGDSGLVSVVVLKELDAHTLFIDTWLMSCRVLKRGMEDFVMNAICQCARNTGHTTIKGEYRPTKKNGMVRELLPQMGFRLEDSTAEADRYTLDVADYAAKKNFIAEE